MECIVASNEGRLVIGLRTLPDGRRRVTLYKADASTDLPPDVPDEQAVSYLAARPGLQVEPVGVRMV